MKYFVLTYLIFLVGGSNALSKSLLERRLDFRYELNQEWCLRLAKSKIQKGIKEPKAYYYASLISLDKSLNSTKLTAKYFLLKSSLFYALHYKKMDKPSDELKLLYDSLCTRLISEVGTINAQLIAKKQSRKANKLHNKLTDLVGKKLNDNPPIAEDNNAEQIPKQVKKVVKQDIPFDGKFYGMASGNELVPIYNLRMEKQLISILNKERKSRGMSELIWDDNLAKAARYHACDMATQKYFSHDSKDRIDGKLVKVGGTFERIRKFYSASFANSENISAGRSTVLQTYLGWYNSPGHYDNMFNSSSKKVGVGLYHDPQSPYKYYWVFCTAR